MRVGLVLGLVCSSAFAQGLQPNGFKMGDGRLHLLGELDSRFDSLVGYFQSQGVPNPEIVFVPRAGLDYELSSPSTSVKVGGRVEYLFYSGLLSGMSSQRLNRLQGTASIETAFNKDGAVEVDLSDSLARTDRTQNPALALGAVSLFNALSLAVPIKPGGRALEITPRVTWSVEFFEALLTGTSSCNTGLACRPEDMNYSNLNFALGGRYRFLPKTAALLDANFDYRTYWNPSAGNLPANILRGRVGLAGLLTPRFSVTLLAGAAYEFAQAATGGAAARTARAAPIGMAELSYLVGDSIAVSVGYLRDLYAVPALGTMSDDRGYLNARLSFLGERLGINGTFAVDYFTFFTGTDMANPYASNRQDLSLSGSLGPSVVVTSWFVVGANYTISFRSSQSAGSSTNFGLNFARHEANLRLTFRY